MLPRLAGRSDCRIVCGGETGKRPGGPQRIGEAEACGEAEPAEASLKVFAQGLFAAEEMGGAGDIDPEALGPAPVERGTVTGAPAGELEKGRGIGFGLGLFGLEMGAAGAGVGEGEAWIESFIRRRAIDRGEPNALLAGGDKRKRGLRRCVAAAIPDKPLDRPMGQPDGNDTRHHSTPNPR